MPATGVGGEHTVGHAACGACRKTKATMELVSAKDMCVLYEHMRVMEAGNTFDADMKMPQGGISFAERYPKVRKQAVRCIWDNYDALLSRLPSTLYFFKQTALSYRSK